jgi:hypothetical protein
VNAAIELFALLFPLQNSIVQESTLEALVKTVKTAKGSISRRNTYCLNTMTAVIGALCYIMMKKGSLANDRVTSAIKDLVYVCVFHLITRIPSRIHILLCVWSQPMCWAAYLGSSEIPRLSIR